MSLPYYITDEYLSTVIRAGLNEDVGSGDVTSAATVSPDARAQGMFVSKQGGVLAGLTAATRVFHELDDTVKVSWNAQEGDSVVRGQELGLVVGPARALLAGERLALNVLQRMSGIATMTRRMVDAVEPLGTRILDTRKTAPGLRPLDKWAVLLGGGSNHRIGLFDMILIKENHIVCAGGLEKAVEAARRYAAAHPRSLRIEVEVTTLEEVERALAMDGIDVLLLDNMTSLDDHGRLDTSMLSEAVRLIGGSVETEASGNVTEETVAEIARTGVNNISCGALTHSVAAMDISLLLDFRD